MSTEGLRVAGHGPVGAAALTVPPGITNTAPQSTLAAAALVKWAKFLQLVQQLDDQLLSTILLQVQLVDFQSVLQRVTVSLPETLSFFKELLTAREALWISALQAAFGLHVQLEMTLASVAASSPAQLGASLPTAVMLQPPVAVSAAVKPNISRKKVKLDFSDQAQWPKTALLLEFFPGIVSEVTE